MFGCHRPLGVLGERPRGRARRQFYQCRPEPGRRGTLRTGLRRRPAPNRLRLEPHRPQGRRGVRDRDSATAGWSDLEFTVDIAGRGPRSDLVTDLAAEFDAVEYHGFVSEAEKRALLDEGSIYVLPTYAEGLPISLLEGMAGGNAIVSTTVGSIPEVVGPDNGHLVDPVDVDGLVEALGALIRDDARRQAMGRTNRAAIEAEHTWAHISDRLLETYGGLTDGDDPAPDRVALGAQMSD
ncbi:glycosyltransferase family 4 protein [Halomicroarcula sp. GCM10025710]